MLTSDQDPPGDVSAPKFSAIWLCNGELKAAAQCIASLKVQTCTDFELVLSDGDSSEATYALVAEARRRNWRLRLVPPGSGSVGERLLELLRSCRGDYIAFLPYEGRFRPSTFDLVMRQFRRRPGIGGLCARGFLVDARGGALPDVDIVTLLLTAYRPFLSAGFIDRRALCAAGLFQDGWRDAAIDLELWSRLAIDHGIGQLDEDVHEDVNDKVPWDWLDDDPKTSLDDRLDVITEIFSRRGFLGGNEPLEAEAKANQVAVLWEHFRRLGVAPIEYFVMSPLAAVLREFAPPGATEPGHLRSLHRLLCTRSPNIGLLQRPLQRQLARAARPNSPLDRLVERVIWRMPLMGYWVKRKAILLTFPRADFHELAPTREELFADVYVLVAELYAARGQTEIALEMWDRAGRYSRPRYDGRANQEILRLPQATNSLIADHQRKWVSRHLPGAGAIEPATVRTATRDRKIHVGYHCAFMNSDTIRYMMRDVVRAHDRSKFVICGYAAGPLAADLKSAFDVVYDTSAAQEPDAFVRLVQNHGIDVFVELSGFSPGHRFAEMSQRCAPVQVSFLNHTGSSHVPNVDYVLADEISLPAGSPDEQHYSEFIYRLPRCFFCFDYRNSSSPEIVDPPSANRPYVTFGCFGQGNKLNGDLIELWSRVLHAVPNSRLWLQNSQLSSPCNREFTRAQFDRLGIDGQRLVLRRGVPRNELLQAYSQIDVCLDTWPYCGGCTVAESLWMGVPVVTLKGDRFGSRYGASLVTAAGCADLVAETPKQYFLIEDAVATDLPRLTTLRRTLRKMSIDHGLGDSTAFARDLENAYCDMLRRLA